MGLVPESGSRLLVPVLNLGVTQVWEVGRVLIYPAGAAAELARAAEAAMLTEAAARWQDVLTEKITEFHHVAVAEVAAGNVDEALPEVAGALAVLRMVQRMLRPIAPSRLQAFGLPGQVMSARVDYLSIAEGLTIGSERIGALAGWSFRDKDHEAWATDPKYRYLHEALRCAEPDRTSLQRRALVAIDLLSEASLSWQPDVALLNAAMALEVLLGKGSDRDKKFRVARRVSYFMCGWPGDDHYPAGNRPACALLALPLNTRGQPSQELREHVDAVNAGRAGPCPQFFKVLDLFDARSRIVHAGRFGLTDKQQNRATWYIATLLLPQVLKWFANHPGADLAELDEEIASLPAAVSPA
jgi:hypothetical protein